MTIHALLHLVALGLIGTVVLTVVRDLRPEWGTLLRLAIGTLLLLAVISPLARAVSALTHLAVMAHIPDIYLGLLFKVVGVAYLTTLAARVAYDTGESAIGSRIELAGKITILLLAIPILSDVTTDLLRMIPS